MAVVGMRIAVVGVRLAVVNDHGRQAELAGRHRDLGATGIRVAHGHPGAGLRNHERQRGLDA